MSSMPKCYSERLRSVILGQTVAVLGIYLFGLCGFEEAQDQTVQLLQLLSDAPSPPGFEEPVRKIMVERMTPLAEHLAYDGLGSVIAPQGSTGPRVMIDAHMDELGAMVRRITPDGYLTMQMLGGWLGKALVDQRCIILGSQGPVRLSAYAHVSLLSPQYYSSSQSHSQWTNRTYNYFGRFWAHEHLAARLTDFCNAAVQLSHPSTGGTCLSDRILTRNPEIRP